MYRLVKYKSILQICVIVLPTVFTLYLGSDRLLCQTNCFCESDGGCHRRPTLFFPSEKRCYYAFLQGPCNEGEWTVYSSKTGYGKCEKRTCPSTIPERPANGADELSTKPFDFIYETKCYRTGTQAFCTKKDELAYFIIPSKTQECVVKISCVENKQRVLLVESQMRSRSIRSISPPLSDIIKNHTTSKVPSYPSKCPPGTVPIGNECLLNVTFKNMVSSTTDQSGEIQKF